MLIDCYSYCGQDDDKKIIFVEKKSLDVNDERVKKYQSEYANIQAYAKQNGYRVLDIALTQEDDYAMEHRRSR